MEKKEVNLLEDTKFWYYLERAQWKKRIVDYEILNTKLSNIASSTTSKKQEIANIVFPDGDDPKIVELVKEIDGKGELESFRETLLDKFDNLMDQLLKGGIIDNEDLEVMCYDYLGRGKIDYTYLMSFDRKEDFDLFFDHINNTVYEGFINFISYIAIYISDKSKKVQSRGKTVSRTSSRVSGTNKK